ncbi:MAG: Fur family transcriptional regulator [Candidatus Dadabacteria bacterium]|nr:Fur family transcriptional regulator [Candidatus Dadabacteria bacterium]MDE0519887.1 Fur family transcriptional regulator [Candidatus Dadabacteria bacterium]MDE0663483.1 Fur family transcriptional regulator [Candidatus Dadabacteria bacterium]
MTKDFECAQESYAREILRENGLKSTAQRLAVVHVLHTSGKSLSVGEIHDGVKNMLGTTGLATIYRTLEMFEDLGIVKRLHFPDGSRGYAFSHGEHVHHMVCVECKGVFDFPECPVESFDYASVREQGFRVKDHFVQLFGQCVKCAEAA